MAFQEKDIINPDGIAAIEDLAMEKDERIHQLEKQLAWYKSFFENATDAVFIFSPKPGACWM